MASGGLPASGWSQASAAGPASAARGVAGLVFFQAALQSQAGGICSADAYSLAESPTEVKFVVILESISGTLTSFFPRVLFSSIHDSFATSILLTHAPRMHIALLLRSHRLLLSSGARLLLRSSTQLMARIQLAIDGLIAHNRLHILARLSKRNGFHKLIHAVILADRLPIRHPAVARVIGGKGIRSLAVKLVQCLLQVTRAKTNIGLRVEQLDIVEMTDALFLGHGTTHRGQQLHQPESVGRTNGPGVELRLLADERGHHVRIQPVFVRLLLNRTPVLLREKNLPIAHGYGVDGRRSIERQSPLQHAHGTEGFTVRGVNLRLGKCSPLIAAVGRLNLRRNVLVQSRVGPATS